MAEPEKPRVLFVDDDPDLLAAVARNLRSEPFDVRTASSAAAALELLKEAGPFAVIVSDLRMPGMDGVALLRNARTLAPDTIRVLFTGQPDLERSIAAVNEGEIFRFLTKPCPRGPMAQMLAGAVEQHRLITAERELLEQTLRGSIRALTEILGLTNPMAFGRATRLRHAVSELLSFSGASGNWHVEVAAMLSQIGFFVLSPATLEKLYRGESLSAAEDETMRRVPAIEDELFGNIPRLEPVREILRYQNKRFDGGGPPRGGVAGERIPWGARALKAILDLDALESDGTPVALALDTLRGRQGWYDPAIVEALAELRNSRHQEEVRELPLHCLRAGMILAQDLKTRKGMLFIARGQEVTASLLEKIRNFSLGLQGDDAVRVIVPEVPSGSTGSRPAAPAPR